MQQSYARQPLQFLTALGKLLIAISALYFLPAAAMGVVGAQSVKYLAGGRWIPSYPLCSIAA